MSPAIARRVPWWAIVIAVTGVAIFSSAGLWQLGRAAWKRELFAAYARGEQSAPRDGLVADADAAGERYRRLRVTGRYDAVRQVLLDNSVLDGRPGYQVLTPLRTSAGAVLVNRGWVPADGDRHRLPDLAVDDAIRTLTGRLDFLPRPALRLDAAPPAADAAWPRLLSFPDSVGIAAQLGYPLRSYQLLLDPDERDGYRREWRPALMAPERHVAYAVQWFALAITVIVLFILMSFRNPKEPGG